MPETFDFIVVGSGSSGGVLAARLSEDGKYSVLCLEAGAHGSEYIFTKSPLGGAFMIHDEKVNWNEFSVPNETVGDRSLHVPHGKILGGSSAINATIANRGQARDYNTWAQLGCRGWGYDDVLPFFRKLESTDIGSDETRGRDGPIRVTFANKLTPFYDLFIASAEAIGLPHNPDYLNGRQEGVAMAQLAANRGRRQSTATQYLDPARSRKNLTIRKGALVSALILDGKRCVGLRYTRNGTDTEVRSGREVILSCGAINSPKLLELSGIGQFDVLDAQGIACRHELPGVGENLRDHFGPMLKWSLTTPGISLSKKGRGLGLVREVLRYGLFGTGFIAQGLGTMRVFARTEKGSEDSDVQMIGNPFLIEVKGAQGQGMSGSHGKRSMSKTNGFFISTQVQRPESTGRVHIRSTDPAASPAIHYRFLETEHDRRVSIAGVRKAREIVAQKPLADHVGEELAPGPNVRTDEQILEFCRNTGGTTYHFVGTCKMGQDPMAVVDERLRVHGIAGLRVADASVMPTIPSGNTSIPCMMVGEKAASMILEDARAAG